MVPAQLEPLATGAAAAPDEAASLPRASKTLHRVPSKQLGSGSGAGLWLSTGSSPTQEASGSGADNQPNSRVHFHESAKPQAVSPTSATPSNRMSKLYHFPATLARGLRFLPSDIADAPELDNGDPEGRRSLARMSSKEELEQSVDLDLSFDYVSTAERPIPEHAGDQTVTAPPASLQAAFVPVESPEGSPREDMEELDAHPMEITTTPSSTGKSPGRGMSASNWAARPAKQPPAPLDLAYPAKLSFDKTHPRRSRSSSRATRPSVDVVRTNSVATIQSTDSMKVTRAPSLDAEDSMSFHSIRSNQSRTSRSSRAPPSQPPSVPLPPVPSPSTSAVPKAPSPTKHTAAIPRSSTAGAILTSDSEVESDKERAKQRRLPMHISTGSESSHADEATDVERHAADLPFSPWPESPLLLSKQNPNANRMVKSASSRMLRAQKSSQHNSMMGLGLGLDLGVVGGADLQPPKEAHIPMSSSVATATDRQSLLRKTASESGLGIEMRRDSTLTPHTELDMTIFADQGPEPTATHMHTDLHQQKLVNRRSRLLDMLHSAGTSVASPTSPATELAFSDGEAPSSAGMPSAALTTPSTLPMLSPFPMTTPYMGRVGMDISANSSVEAFACNITPPMPSATFSEKGPASVQRKSEDMLQNSSFMHQMQNMRTRFSYRVAMVSSWPPQQPTKPEIIEPNSRPIKEKQSPLPSPTAVFESGPEGKSNQRASVSNSILNPDGLTRRRRSTMVTTWAPASNPSALLRSVPRTIALGQPKRRRTATMFGNAAFNAPARTPATTNMLPNGTLLSKSLFFAGFCGMPWLWLVGGWWLGPDGMLVSDTLTKVYVVDGSDSDSDADSDGESEVDFILSPHKVDHPHNPNSEWHMVDADADADAIAEQEQEQEQAAPRSSTSAEHFRALIHGPGSRAGGGSGSGSGSGTLSPSYLHPSSAQMQMQRGGSAGTSATRSATATSHDGSTTTPATTTMHGDGASSRTAVVAYPRVLLKKGKKSGSLAEYYDAMVRPDWGGLEPYVRYNRIASLFGTAFILVALILAIWGVALYW